MKARSYEIPIPDTRHPTPDTRHPTPGTRTPNIAFMMLAALMLMLASCDEPVMQPIDAVEPLADLTPVDLRIVTLAPALTQMVVDLGLGDQIVGVVRNDDAAPSSAVVLGTHKEIDYERLLQIDPTHVLMMTDKDGVPARLEEMSTRGTFLLASFNYPERILDVYEVLTAPTAIDAEARDVATVLGVKEKGDELFVRVQRELSVIGDLVEANTPDDARPPKVLMVIGTNPVRVSGPDTVLDELLWKHAKGLNAVPFDAGTAPTYDRERLLELEPDVILMIMPGARPLGSIAEDVRLAAFRDMDVPAVTQNRIVLIDHPLAMLPSTSMPRIAAEMAKAVHPDLADKIDAALREPLPPLEDLPAGDIPAPPLPPILDD